MKNELWKPIKGYEGYYEVSNMGRIRRKIRKRPRGRRVKTRLIKFNLNRPPRVKLRDAYGNEREFKIKTLVANHWLNPRTGAKVHFIDGTYNCAVSNLSELKPPKKMLSLTQKQRIKFEVSLGVKPIELARKYNISASLITMVLQEKLNFKEIKLPPKNVEERFFKKVKKIDDATSCWEWIGSKDKDGYGRFGLDKKIKRAHRVSWELHFGPIPAENCVSHKCDNPPCIRPDHLFLGTVYDNNHDKEKKNRQARGENNGMRKLSEEEITEIRELYTKGRTQKDIAAVFGVTSSAISRIVRNQRWSHVGEYADWFGETKKKGINKCEDVEN